MRVSLVLRRGLAAVCVAGLSATLLTAATPAPAPKLVVLLMVDQMRGDYIDRFASQWHGGLKQLVEHGAWFRRADYPYANTVTCAGHASVSTGDVPATHGLILNDWWDRQAGREVTCTEDASVRNIGYGGHPVKGGESLARLMATTLSDELRAQLSPAGHAIAFSLKARAAATLAGHRPDAVAWFDDGGTWATSTAFSAAPVPAVNDFIARHPVDADFGKTWDRSLPLSDYLFETPAVGVTAPKGMTDRFPHALSGAGHAPDKRFYTQWQSSPYSDDYLATMALDVAGQLHFEQGGATNFIGISFSALDKVGHDYGPNSHEVQDVLIRLDRTLATFFAGLDRLVGAGNWTVALAADHGVAPIPERAQAEALPAGRVDVTRVVQAIEAPLVQAFGPGKYVTAYVHSEVYLADGVYAKLTASAPALAALRASLRAVPGIADVLTSTELSHRASTGDARINRFTLSYMAGRSGDLTVVYRPYWVDDATGTSHGTPYTYDTHIPILLMGKGIAPGEYLQPASPVDIAPTLAFLAGVTLPNADGRVLTEALH
jgi:predicted AlkP superfamily pyrophosphatase or phosphodiesterase